jgi:hypothetical protein
MMRKLGEIFFVPPVGDQSCTRHNRIRILRSVGHTTYNILHRTLADVPRHSIPWESECVCQSLAELSLCHSATADVILTLSVDCR